MAIDFEREEERDKKRSGHGAQRQSTKRSLPAKGIVDVATAVGHIAPLSPLGSDMPASSPVGGVVQMLEAVEEGTAPGVDIDARMERYPELRGVEVPTGNAARYPELVEEAPRPHTEEPAQDDEYGR
jgi:hypothetical protein